MGVAVFFAVLGAAILHAGWNALVKGGSDKLLSMSGVMLGHVPFAVLALCFVPAPDPASFGYLAAGVALHVGYQFFLLRSYETGDLTQVYPIARGSAPLIVTAVSLLVLGVELRGLELLGVLVIGCGILSLALVRRADGMRNGSAAMTALVTGCFIAGYSIIDGLGARAAGSSVGYYAWLSIIGALPFSAYVWKVSPGTFRDLAGKGRAVFWIGGGASFAAYSIVTWAFTQAPIALVTALRETSIIFALLIGVFVLKERLDLAKLASTMMTVLGVVLMRLARL
ncbi:EamA family transporter [Alphaproteobacteria bacterium KMM 3653]|uniref:EamA family transporter n=1 Tax=Harenicola maris TaxID=2841044 RepID=A0AAP2CT44_9RHOB|nr:EamA family transporter [Harenicola maris]